MTTNPSPYTARAEEHWKKFLPEDYRKIPEQERPAFFARLAGRIEDRITVRTEELLEQEDPQADPPRFMDSLAAMMTAKTEAERQVLAEMLPAPADPEETREAGR